MIFLSLALKHGVPLKDLEMEGKLADAYIRTYVSRSCVGFEV